MKRLVSLTLSVALLAIPTSAMARGGGHGHGGHGSHGHHHHGHHHHHHFHGHGGVVALPFWSYSGPVYYYDSLGVYLPDAMIYDPQNGMVWVPGHWEWVGAHQVWVPGHWEQLRPNS